MVAISTVSDFAWLSALSSLLHERGVQNSSLAGCIKHVVACAGSNGHRRMKVARRVSGFLFGLLHVRQGLIGPGRALQACQREM